MYLFPSESESLDLADDQEDRCHYQDKECVSSRDTQTQVQPFLS